MVCEKERKKMFEKNKISNKLICNCHCAAAVLKKKIRLSNLRSGIGEYVASLKRQWTNLKAACEDEQTSGRFKRQNTLEWKIVAIGVTNTSNMCSSSNLHLNHHCNV